MRALCGLAAAALQAALATLSLPVQAAAAPPPPGPSPFGLVLVAGHTLPSAGGEESSRRHPGSFYIGRHEVTQEQWSEVMGSNPSRFAGCGKCPVENVSWEDVGDFLARASESSGIPLRLPFEEEWEFAASGASAHTEWPGTEKAFELAEFAWFSGSFTGRTHPVGLKEPNALGLFDMAGNVAEWCADRFEADSTGEPGIIPPEGETAHLRRAVRGGSWLSGPSDLRLHRRSGRSQAARSPTLGFRLAADAPLPREPLPK